MSNLVSRRQILAFDQSSSWPTKDKLQVNYISKTSGLDSNNEGKESGEDAIIILLPKQEKELVLVLALNPRTTVWRG